MTGLSIAVRLLHLAAATQLVGAFVFLLVVARPAFQRGGPVTETAAKGFDRRMFRLAAWALLVAGASGLAALVLQAASVTGSRVVALSAADVGRLLGDTRYGHVWLFRMAGLLLLGAFLVFREGERDARDWWALRLEGAFLGALALAALAWAGHAAAVEGWEAWALAADTAHLVATGAWLGGLVPLALLFEWSRREPGAEPTLVAREATRRFSALALGGVSVLALSGLFNLWVHVRELPALVGTPYGRLLLVKVGLFAPLVGVAAVNRTRLKPRLLHASSPESMRSDLGRLYRNVILEALLGLGILLVVSGLGVTPPARHVPPTWPFPFRFAWEIVKDVPGVRTRVAIGSQAAMFGLVAALLAAITRRRRWGWIAGAGAAALAAGLAVALPPLAVDAYPTTYVRPTVPYTAISIARGLTHYRTHCAVCHGAAGYGDGPGAAGLPKKPADLTAKHAADHTVGDLFWWLSRGIPASAMPGFAERLFAEDRWDLINFLRTLAAAEQARVLGPVVTPTATIVAPDFAFTTGVGDDRSLKDLRGQSIVVLALFGLPDSFGRLADLTAIYPALRRLGAEILAIPVATDRDVYRAIGARPAVFPILVDGAAEAATTYALFHRDLTPEGRLRQPREVGHMELLVDRQGYVRARWILEDGGGWAEPSRLVAEVEQLAGEVPRAPAPDEHVH